MSADPEQEYFCDGMADEIINALARVKGLRVVARTSAFSFKGKEQDVRDNGKALNVETLLEGSVRKSGNRITAQLIKIADGYHLWSERFDRELADVFDIQDEISLAVVDQLKVELLGGEKAAVRKPLPMTSTSTIFTSSDAFIFIVSRKRIWQRASNISRRPSRGLPTMRPATRVWRQCTCGGVSTWDSYRR